MRRVGVTNRFSKKQSGSEFAAKSKKVMLKKLKKQEIVFDFSHSDLEIEVSMKKSNLLKKNMKEESNGVDHASVPRKLRSAMKKRNLESVSKLSSKRLNRSKTGIESFKKENQEMEAKAIVIDSMMISKDEKEVAETLYGLAGMFKETNTNHNKTCGPSDPLSDEKQTTKVDTSLVVEAGCTKTESLDHSVLVSVSASDKTTLISVMTLDQSHSNLDRLKQTSSVNVTARAIETKVENNGLALWPGLSSTVRHGSHCLSKPSSTTNLPHWMGQAVSPSNNASHSCEPLRVQPRKLKKCASHIYISQLIKALQNSKSSHINQNHQRYSSERVLLDPGTTISDFKIMVTPSKRHQNPHILDINRAHSTKPVQEDMNKLAFDLYGPHTLQKQSYDFLTLSSTREASQSHLPRYPISTAYNSQLSPSTSSHQVQPISPYLANRFQTAYNANQQQQLQKKLWAGQYRNGYTVQPSNQYSKPNLSLNLASSIQQPLHVASSPRYNNNVPQQQHRLMASSPMSMSHDHNMVNRQEQRFPLIYEDTKHHFNNYSAANSREDALLYS